MGVFCEEFGENWSRFNDTVPPGSMTSHALVLTMVLTSTGENPTYIRRLRVEKMQIYTYIS